jgi:hypothetical protein
LWGRKVINFQTPKCTYFFFATMSNWWRKRETKHIKSLIRSGAFRPPYFVNYTSGMQKNDSCLSFRNKHCRQLHQTQNVKETIDKYFQHILSQHDAYYAWSGPRGNQRRRNVLHEMHSAFSSALLIWIDGMRVECGADIV